MVNEGWYSVWHTSKKGRLERLDWPVTRESKDGRQQMTIRVKREYDIHVKNAVTLWVLTLARSLLS